MDLSTLNDLIGPKNTLYIAFSGGADSMCLAHRLTTDPAIGPQVKKICLHVDHGLDGSSSERAERATELANKLKLTCRLEIVQLEPDRNVEAKAREARYAFFERILRSGDVLVTAHHKDDVAETLMLRMLRGVGIAGLRGIEVDQPFGPGRLIRPLLDWSRAQIVDYLHAHKLDWIDDPTNELMSIDRNFIRHDIMPRLLERFPGAQEALNRSAALNRQAAAFLTETLNEVVRSDERDHERLCMRKWGTKSAFEKAEIIRMWCLRKHMPPPPGKPLESFVSQIHDPRADRLPTLQWGDCVIYCYRKQLWLQREQGKPLDEQVTYDLVWDGQKPLALPFGLGTLQLDLVKLGDCGGIKTSQPLNFRVTSRQADEQIQWGHPIKMHRTKRLLSDAHIPPWERDLWPRLWLGEQLLACGARWQSPELHHALSWETGCFGAQPNR